MARKAKKQLRKSGAGAAHKAASAPSFDELNLSGMPSFDALQATPEQLSSFEELKQSFLKEDSSLEGQLFLAVVVRLDRGYPAILSEFGLMRAEFSADITKGRHKKASAETNRVAVGDWLLVRITESHEKSFILSVLPRKTELSRWRGSSRGERQVLAANVDSMLIAHALQEDRFDYERVLRSALIAADSKLKFSVVLTKVDRVTEAALDKHLHYLRALFGSSINIFASSSFWKNDISAHESYLPILERYKAQWGLEAIKDFIPADETALILGLSGAGKSTLINSLLGEELLETNAVRSSDDLGRHTTVSRRMVSIPGAGNLIDEPGLRTLLLLGHERGLGIVFPELVELSQNCKFRNCSHEHEPGCAIQEKLAAGEVLQERVSAFLLLIREMKDYASSLDPDILT